MQRHDATRLHYDFRLELNGALASWAVPKGVPLEPGQQHLAVHVEDHPLDYATFEGEIPKGNYGAGTVEIWDSGTYELLEQKRNGGLTVRLHGKKLDGVWTLVPAKLGGDEKNWLILRKREEQTARRAGRSDRCATRRCSRRSRRRCRRATGGCTRSSGTATARSRTSAAVTSGSLSRNGNDLTSGFRRRRARRSRKAVRTPNAVLDGEVCRARRGRPRDLLRDAAGQGRHAYLFVAFDVLEVDGEPVVD